MASNSEVGHAKNVANLQKLIQQVSVFSNYNPPVEYLKISELETLYNQALQQLGEVDTKRNAYKDAIYARQVAFEDLKETSTKIINQLEILNLSQGKIDQAKSLNREIQGSKIKKVPNPDQPVPDADPHSTSRQSYTQLAANFSTLLELLSTLPEYQPNEEELTVAKLTDYNNTLLSSTLPVDQTLAEFNNQLIQRNNLFYKEDTGLYSIAQNVKKYVKSVYGATSPEFAAVSDIKFTDQKP